MKRGANSLSVGFNRVDGAFFDVFGARFRSGRSFDATDLTRAQAEAIIVNRTFAEEIIGVANPLGRRVRYLPAEEGTASAKPEPWYEIVGVVEDFPANNDRPTIYHPLPAAQARPVSLTLRVRSSMAAATAALRESTAAVDRSLPVSPRPLADIYWQRRSVYHTLGFVLGSILLIVLLFAMAGMYVLMAFVVTQRWREVGLRASLGAQPGQLVMGIFGRSLVPLMIGAGAGCLVALAVGSVVPIEQAGGARIPGIVPASAALIVAVGVLALAGPARRALRINPADALRVG